MKLNNTKLAKTERPYPPHEETKVRKKKVQCVSDGTSGESSTSSVDPGTFGTEFGMQMIADRFGDGWHKTITRFSGVQRIAALFGDAVT